MAHNDLHTFNYSLELLMLLYEAQSGLYDKKLMVTKMRIRHEQLTVLLRLAHGKGQISTENNLKLAPLLVSIGKQLTSRSQKLKSSLRKDESVS